MKLDTIILLSKGFAYMLVGIFTPWSAALAQWINSGTWPDKIVWIGVILPASVVGGATQWISFTSNAWTNYHQARKNGTGNTEFLTKPATTNPS